MSKAAITIEAFIANELSIREAGGHRVLDVSLPHTPSRKNQQTGAWEDDGPTTWFQATFWDEHADDVLRTVQKSSLVTVTGYPEIEVYRKNDGEPGGKVLIKFPTIAAVIRKPKAGSASSSVPPNAGQDDIWNTPGTFNDETPF